VRRRLYGALDEEILQAGYEPRLKNKNRNPKHHAQHGDDGLPFPPGKVRPDYFP